MDGVKQVNPKEMVASPINPDQQLEFIPVEKDSDEQELHNERMNAKMSAAKSSMIDAKDNKERKFAILLQLKQEYPVIDLRKYIEMMGVSSKGLDSYDNQELIENFEIADQVENHFLKKFRKWVKKSVKKVGRKVGKFAGRALKGVVRGVVKVAGNFATRLTGLPINKLTDQIDKVGFLKGQKKKILNAIVENKADILPTATVQAIAPQNAVESKLSKLAPLRSTMAKALQTKGIATSNQTSLEDIATMFRDIVVKRQNNYNTSWYENDIMYQYPEHYFQDDQLNSSQSQLLVDEIIHYFKTASTRSNDPVNRQVGGGVAQYKKEKQKDELKTLASDVNKGFSFLGAGNQKFILIAIAGLALVMIMRK